MTHPSESAGVKRRDFLKVLGAAGAATTTVGCFQEDVEKLIPYLVSPDDTVPGVSTYYATTCRECASGCGVIAETRDGRAIKLEGNPAHPVNKGALCARGQAALQGLYNPDRYREPMVRRNGRLERISWDDATRMLRERVAGLGAGAVNAVFINQHETGSFPAFLDQWLAGYSMPAHIAYDGEAPHAVLQANRQSFGVAWPALDFSAAQLVVAVGADFLDTWGASVPQQLAFADARAKLGKARDTSDAEDYYVYSDNETVQVQYDTDKTVKTISVNYIGSNPSAPAAKLVFGSDAEAKPDGGIFKMVRYPKAGCWISYNKTTGDNPMVVVTMQKMSAAQIAAQ